VTTTTDVREVNNSTNKQNIMSVYPIEDKVNPTGKDDVETKVVDTDPANQGYIESDDQTALALYEIPDDERRRLLRRLDSRIAPLVMILYLIAFLDRSELLLESDRLFAILMNRASISFHYRQHRYA
jgi:hypothetical protein